MVLADTECRSFPRLTHFAIRTAAGGAIDLAICAVAWHSLALSDLVGAGIGVAVQGTALLLLDLILASAIARG